METYAALLNLKIIVLSSKTNYLAVEKNYWSAVFANKVDTIHLQEEWYLRRYPDVADAIAQGVIDSARQHYRESGYYEHRMPYQINVDGDWYMSEYPDVRAAVEEGQYASAQGHFEEIGFKEGRHPYAGFALHTITPHYE